MKVMVWVQGESCNMVFEDVSLVEIIRPTETGMLTHAKPEDKGRLLMVNPQFVVAVVVDTDNGR